MEKALRKAFYIFILGVATYYWWKFVGEIRRRLQE